MELKEIGFVGLGRMGENMVIYIAADHAAVTLKENIKEFLNNKGLKVEDLGSNNPDSDDDYPDFAFKVAEKVSNDNNSKGILICGSGTGMVIAANKVKGIRAAVIYDAYSAKMARSDNDTNIACLRARKFSSSKVLKIIEIWLATEFSDQERHKRRIKKIKEYEK